MPKSSDAYNSNTIDSKTMANDLGNCSHRKGDFNFMLDLQERRRIIFKQALRVFLRIANKRN